MGYADGGFLNLYNVSLFCLVVAIVVLFFAYRKLARKLANTEKELASARNENYLLEVQRIALAQRYIFTVIPREKIKRVEKPKSSPLMGFVKAGGLYGDVVYNLTEDEKRKIELLDSILGGIIETDGENFKVPTLGGIKIYTQQ